jgi:hypothetical protein
VLGRGVRALAEHLEQVIGFKLHYIQISSK